MKQWIDYKKLKGDLFFTIVLEHYDLKHDSAKTQDMILCPFHDEKTPSCSVNKDKGVFRCFGCDTGGNVLDFVCFMEDCDPDKSDELRQGATVAIQDILSKEVGEYDRASSGKPVRSPQKRKPSKKRAARAKPVEAKAEADTSAPAETVEENKPLSFELQNLDREHPFFSRHGISAEAVETFGFGFCQRGTMSNRIVIPIHNRNGELVAYAGRWHEEDVPEDESRYKLPKNFSKSLELFNLHRAVDLMGSSRTVVVVEGFWSVARLHCEGIPVVGAFGTALSDTQVLLLAEYADKAILIFDGDSAGQEGSLRSAASLSQHVCTRRIVLPEGEKPDSMDIEQVRSLLA